MTTKRLATYLAVVACLAGAPALARAQGVLIEGFGGYQGLRGLAPGDVGNASHEGTALVGGDLLFEMGGFGIGALVDKTVSGNFGQPWTGSILAGFSAPLAILRLEILGELGRRSQPGGDFGDIFKDSGHTIIGVRPGVRFRIAPTPISIGAAVVLRWPTSGGDFGSPDYGFVGRVGFEFP